MSESFSRTQSANPEQSVVSCYNEGVRYRKAGLHNEAEDKFRQALLRNKRHVPSIVGLGSLLRESGRAEEGDRLLKEACSLIGAGSDSSSLAHRSDNTARPTFQRTSSLSAFTALRPPGNISSLKQAGDTVKKHLHLLKMANALGGNKAGGLLGMLKKPVVSDVDAQPASSSNMFGARGANVFSRVPSAPAAMIDEIEPGVGSGESGEGCGKGFREKRSGIAIRDGNKLLPGNEAQSIQKDFLHPSAPRQTMNLAL